jgi:histidinol dehydrogenase
MQTITTRQQTLETIIAQLRSRRSSVEDIQPVVQNIIDIVRQKGDQALYAYAEKFDRAHLASLQVSRSEIQQAQKAVSHNANQARAKNQDPAGRNCLAGVSPD